MPLSLWINFIIVRSSQINKEYCVKSKQFISLNTLLFHKELQLINYPDLTQEMFFISLYWLVVPIRPICLSVCLSCLAVRFRPRFHGGRLLSQKREHYNVHTLVCTPKKSQFFTSKNPEHPSTLKMFSRTGADF